MNTLLEVMPSQRTSHSQPVWMVDLLSFTPWYTASLAKALVCRGVPLRLHCAPVAREPGYFDRHGLQQESGPLERLATVTHPRFASRALRSSAAMSNAWRLLRQLRSSEHFLPRLLHLQQVPLLNHGIRLDFALVEAAHQRRIPVVHTVHNILPHDTGESLRHRYAELYRRVDHLVCHSGDAAQRLMSEFDIAGNRLTIIPHGPLFASSDVADAGAVARAREELGLARDVPVVLWQGVVAPYKGVDVLLRAWKRCLSRWAFAPERRPVLVIAGTGAPEHERKIERLAASCGDSVKLMLRYIRTDELPTLYQAADLLVYPYREITTSGAMLTGLSYEKPIIASDLDAFRGFVIHDQNGLLVPPGDSDELADALYVVLNPMIHREDRDLCCDAAVFSTYSRLLAGARQNRRRYTDWDAIAQATTLLYQRLVADH